jgi:WD40 repeat protein
MQSPLALCFGVSRKKLRQGSFSSGPWTSRRAAFAWLCSLFVLVAFLAVPRISFAQERATFEEHRDRVAGLAFSPDGKRLASASFDLIVWVWDPTDPRKQIARLKGHFGLVYSCAFSPDGSLLATGGNDHRLRLWETQTWQETAGIEVLPVGDVRSYAPLSALVFSKDGKRIFTTCSACKEDGLDAGIKVWDSTTREPIVFLKGHRMRVVSMALAGDEKTAVTGSIEGIVKLWDLEAGKEQASWLAHNDGKGLRQDLYAVAMSPNGKTVATAGKNPSLRLWDPTTGKEKFTLKTGMKIAHCVQFSPDGKTVAAGGEDGELELWDVATGTLHSSTKRHTERIACVAFSPDGKLLATGSWDRTVKVWDVDKLLPAKPGK